MIIPFIKTRRHKKGFTLTETVIAMAVVGLLLTTFMAVFLPSKKRVQGALALQEADRVASALSSELAVLRQGEQKVYTTAFDKAFEWMLSSSKASTTVLIYNYRGDLTQSARVDGSLKPYEGKHPSVPGASTLVLPAVILATDQKRFKEDFKAIVGPVFLVRMTQFIWDQQGANPTQNQYGGKGGRYVLAKRSGVISNPYNEGQMVTKSADYVYNTANSSELPWGAEVLFQAEFFQMPIVQPEGLNRMDYKNFKKPLFKRNLSFRR